MDSTEIIKTAPSTPKPTKLKPKQQLAINYWLEPTSETFGNLYQSMLKANFRPSYALNVSHLKPLWLSESIDQMKLDPEHIKQGVQRIATGRIDSRSVDDTRLKAYEMLGKWTGMDKDTHKTTIIVQPILGGQSVKHDKRIHIDSEQSKPESPPTPDKPSTQTDK